MFGRHADRKTALKDVKKLKGTLQEVKNQGGTLTKKLEDARKELKIVSQERDWEREKRVSLEGDVARLQAQLRKARGLRPRPCDLLLW